MTKTFRRNLGSYRAVLMVISVVTLLSACSSGPPPRMYLLEPSEWASDVTELRAVSGIKLLGMSPVVLPDYTSDNDIVSLRLDGSVYKDDANRWAQDPDDAVTNFLSKRLRMQAATTVLVEPWPRDYEPAARVEVSFDKLLRQSSGGAEMSGQILLLSGSGRKLLKAIPFDISHGGMGYDSQEFFNAVAKGIDDIARIAVEEIKALSTKS